jgi:hypothetical protein
MLQYLHLKNVGLAPDVRVDWAERVNLIAGDNGLGKSFLLDLAWWALTRTWASAVAMPAPSAKKATIEYVVKGVAKAAAPVTSTFRRADESWPLKAARPTMPGIVVYIRIDGGFSVWDPARNYWRTDPARPAAYHFQAPQVWDGLDIKGQRVCEGLERDWVNWQEGRKPQFKVLEDVLRVLSPPSEPLRVGQPQRVFLGEGRDRPTCRCRWPRPVCGGCWRWPTFWCGPGTNIGPLRSCWARNRKTASWCCSTSPRPICTRVGNAPSCPAC